MTRLISVGNVVIDLVAVVPALPERGGDVVASASDLSPGGSFNVLVAAARAGLPSSYGGTVGTGPFADVALAALRSEGIGILLEPVPELDTGYDVALIDSGGERTFITVVGAEAALTAGRLAQVQPAEDDLVQVSGYGLLREPNRSAIVTWLQRLPAGVLVLCDPGPLAADVQPSLLAEVRSRSDWFSCNAREAQALTGLQPERAAAELAVGGRGVLVRLGLDGCLLLPPGGRLQHVPGYRVDAVDLNGAGDAHTGAFLAALATGHPPLAAARRANAAAALAVTRRGPATAPDAATIDAFLAAG